MSQVKKIIFVDEENTGLSPFAAALFRKMCRQEGIGIQAVSRGTVVLFPEPVNRKLADIAGSFDVYLESHQAQALDSSDFTADTLVLALDNSSKNRVFEMHTGFTNIFTLKEYVGEVGDIRLPLGETVDKYEAVCKELSRLLNLIIENLKGEDTKL